MLKKNSYFCTAIINNKYYYNMKRILNLLALMLVMLPALALEKADFGSIPEKYLPRQCALVASPTSACNQGDEPFSTFIAKWNKSKKFREERIYAFDDFERESIGYQFPAINIYGLLPMAPKKGVRKYKTYFSVTANTVGFYSYSIDGAGWIQFQRIDGKWYVVGLAVAG